MISIERYINNERQGHVIVGHGYQGNDIYVNFGWGNRTAHTTLSTNGNDFTSNLWNGKITRVDKIIIH
ncbi:hypothetical protein HG442_002500 [Candidatus Gracilibacteria bacterium]|nr:hypothetical protein [Candidatus Gracilibacteria bacterium]